MNRKLFDTEARLFCQQQQELIFNEFCMQVIKLLTKNPQGLTIANVQTCIGMSYKTAMRVLALVAVGKDGKFYLDGGIR